MFLLVAFPAEWSLLFAEIAVSSDLEATRIAPIFGVTAQDWNERCYIICYSHSPDSCLKWLCFHSLPTLLISSCTQPGQFCFILIAYFRLKKLVFLDYFDVEMGAGEQFTFIRQYAPPRTPPSNPHSLFCANSRIPIYILAVELNYCKHLCGPARHNRLAGSRIMSVPPTGYFWLHTIVHSRHVWHSELVETQWNELFFFFFLLACWNIY